MKKSTHLIQETGIIEICCKLRDNGIECYSFGNISNEEIGCGQLVQNQISKK